MAARAPTAKEDVMTDQYDTSTDRRIRAGQTAKIVAWVVVLGAIALFCIVNTQTVSIDWVFGDSENALWIVIALSALAGFVVGYLTSYRRR
jgi:uncharacterized integral membrane protein